MMRLLFLAALAILALPSPSLAQFELLIARNGGLEVAGAALDFGSVPIGDKSEILLRLRNRGNTAAELGQLRVTGAGFRLEGEPRLPSILASQQLVAFRIIFQPGQPGPRTGQLDFTGGNTSLAGTALQTFTVQVLENNAVRTLQANDRVNFGSLLIGEKATRQFTLLNPNPEPLTVGSLELIGANYTLLAPPSVPFVLAPGARVGVSVEFTAIRGGNQPGSLVLDGRRFGLDAFVPQPDPPDPVIDAPPGPWSSASVIPLQVKFPKPALGSGKGVLRVEFVPLNTRTKDDPAIQLSSGSRSIEFSFSRGDESVQFPGGALSLQTGTTAGKLLITAAIEEKNQRMERDIAPATVGISSLSVTRGINEIVLRFSAFDNSRTASTLRFVFRGSNGVEVPPGEIPIEAPSQFAKYFDESSTAGAFSVEARFPVTGDASAVRSVSVRVDNAVGFGAAKQTEF